MAATLLSDVLVPALWAEYAREQYVKRSTFFRSGIVVNDPVIANLVAKGSNSIDLPFWKPYTGDSQVRESGATLTINKITTSKEVARLNGRSQVVGYEDLAAELSGGDPAGAILNYFTNYWDIDTQKMLLAILDGIFADNLANDSGDLIYDITGDTEKELTAEGIIKAMQKLGDAKMKIAAMAIHSQVHANLQAKNLIDYIPNNQQDIGWGTYFGKTIIVNDELPVVSDGSGGYNFTSYLFAPGSLAYADAPVEYGIEDGREKLNGLNYIINRRNFILHPRGFKWLDASRAKDFPTNVELALAANWDRVYEKKNTGIIKIVSKG